MSKGIIIVDVPEQCEECPVRHMALAYCPIMKKSTSHHTSGKPMDEKKRPNWCPIRPMPAKKKKYGIDSRRLKSFKNGWNAAIDELMGGSDG